MGISQNDIEYLKDMVSRGEISAAEANVELVLYSRVKLVTGKLPKDVRKSLNDAVKSGKLAHLKKDGYYPECYYHPSFDYLARSERRKAAENIIKSLSNVLAMDDII